MQIETLTAEYLISSLDPSLSGECCTRILQRDLKKSPYDLLACDEFMTWWNYFLKTITVPLDLDATYLAEIYDSTPDERCISSFPLLTNSRLAIKYYQLNSSIRI